MSVCDLCNKVFERKSGLEQHKKRKNPCTKSPNKAISLFSGCGGDTLGLERAGITVVAFLELKKTFIESHKENFPNSKLISDSTGKITDITKIETSQFENIKADIVFAGFPCQGFSNAGKKQIADPRNQLYQQFIRVVKQVRPRFIIGENVQGLDRMKSGPSLSDPLMIDLIKNDFAKIGYKLIHKIHEATNFGVPQKRKRLIIIGWDQEQVSDTTNLWEEIEANGHKNKMVTLRSFITNSMEGAYQIPTAAIPANFEKFALPISQEACPSGKPHPYIILKANAKLLSCKKRDSGIHSEIIDLDAPSKTIICTYGHCPRLLVGLRKPDGTSYLRTLLPDELKQIQGFPADYKLMGNQSEQITQIGNAVPPPMIEAIALTLRSKL